MIVRIKLIKIKLITSSNSLNHFEIKRFVKFLEPYLFRWKDIVRLSVL